MVFKSHNMHLVSILIFVLLSGVQCTISGPIPIKDIDHLIFNKGELTTGRRVDPIQQMICTTKCSGPNLIVCKNKDLDGTDVIWECEAPFDKGIELGKFQVSCEGYDYPEDPNILSGSCSISYSLIDTNQSRGEYFVKFLAIFIWIIIIVYICGFSTSTNYRRTSNSRGGYSDFVTGFLFGSISNHSKMGSNNHNSTLQGRTVRR